MACPRCGSEMVLRRSQKGGDQNNQFWVCSRYPRCRGIVNIA
ncbi:topoisomerase DNA-binding C4 zinc finger domain-containing protein [Desulfonatronospira sp.]